MAVICGNCRETVEEWSSQTYRRLQIEPTLPAHQRWCPACEARAMKAGAKFPKEPKSNRTGLTRFLRGVDRDQFGED
jgi:hypothetical protein